MQYRFQLSQLNIFFKRILLALSAFFSSYRLGRTQVFDSNIKISRNRGRKITKNTFLSRLNLYSQPCSQEIKKEISTSLSYNYYIKFLKILTGNKMSFPGFYLDYSSYFSNQYSGHNFNAEFWKIMETNKQLEEKNSELKKKVDLLENENHFQKKEINQLRKLINRKQKRKYSKRRTWLQKKFKCQYDGCQSKYSSQVALNCHIKKKHLENEDSDV